MGIPSAFNTTVARTPLCDCKRFIASSTNDMSSMTTIVIVATSRNADLTAMLV